MILSNQSIQSRKQLSELGCSVLGTGSATHVIPRMLISSVEIASLGIRIARD